MNSRLRVSGNIISELSDKIPSNIIALNELIKNAYDAGAPKVSIDLDTEAGVLTVSDDGSGMNLDDINTLFHISKSSKKYGTINKYDRHTQGAKGLGFLSVFKFGKQIEWRTRTEDGKGYRFFADYDSILRSEDISTYEIGIEEVENLKKGTTIIIALDEYNKKSLVNYFSVVENSQKILYAFDDEGFTIELKINGSESTNSNRFPLKKHVEEYQLFYIVYNSEEKKIKYYYNDCEIHKEDFPFYSTEYKVDIELNIYHFPPYGKDKVDRLFINPKKDITPLVYINSNLFNNYEIFDPSVMRHVRSSSVLSQMIGYVRIKSESEMISFNSDRSKFLQNELTDEIVNFLTEINKKIQSVGAEKKNRLVKFDIVTVSELPAESNDYTDCEQFRKYIQDDFAFKSAVKIERKKNKVVFEIFGKRKEVAIKPKNNKNMDKNDSEQSESDKKDSTGSFTEKDKKEENGDEKKRKIVPAVINLNNSSLRFAVPTEQIDLKSYIASVYDSFGEIVSSEQIKVKIDGIEVVEGILPSIANVCKKEIEYSFVDDQTGIVMKNLGLECYRLASKVIGSKKEECLITLPAKELYKVDYNQSVSNLITQINSLKYEDYFELISCALRAGFEMSTDTINKSVKYSNFFHKIGSFEGRVEKVIDYIKQDDKIMSEISNSAKIDYKSFCKMMDTKRFREGIYTAHLGAHKSDTYVSEIDVKQLAKLLGLFVVVVNEMIQNPNIS